MAEPAEKLPRTVDEFLRWAEDRSGRYELVDGRVVAMAPERAGHARARHRVARRLEEAIERAGLPCEVFPDGMTVRIDAHTAFEPDALVRCGEPLPPDAVEVPDPLVVVEVVSPRSETVDLTVKLEGYFRVPSIRHYLVVEPEKRFVIHHERSGEGEIRTRILHAGIFRLDPPGIELAVEDLFPPQVRREAGPATA